MWKIGKGIKLLIALIGSILMGIWIGNTYDKQEPTKSENSRPPCPDTTKPMYFDFVKGVWQYIYLEDRANEPRRISKPLMNEQDVQRYMEKKIPGYLEDTYWGEEYDLDDPDNQE